MKKTCPWSKINSPTRCAGEPTFPTFPYKTWRTAFREKQNVGSTAKRLTPPPPSNPHPTPHLGGSSPNGPTFLHIYVYLTLWLAHLGQLGQGNTIRACAGAYGSSKGVSFFLTWTLAKVDYCIQIPSSFKNLIWFSVRDPNCKLSERRKT